MRAASEFQTIVKTLLVHVSKRLAIMRERAVVAVAAVSAPFTCLLARRLL